MPYIKPERRAHLDCAIEELQAELAGLGNEEGDLNYAISRLIGAAFEGTPKYRTIARMTGVLENVKSEFYRRVAGPYEDKAIEKNGDIPEFE